MFDCEICCTIYGRTIHVIKLHNTWIHVSSLTIHGHKVAQICTSSCTIHGHQVAQYMDSSYHLWHILANKKNLEISAKVKFKVAIWKLIHYFISAPCSNLVSIWSCLVPISWSKMAATSVIKQYPFLIWFIQYMVAAWNVELRWTMYRCSDGGLVKTIITPILCMAM